MARRLGSFSSVVTRIAITLALGALGVGFSACRKNKNSGGAPRPSASASASANAPAKLTPEQAAQVLARVGERTITLGDYAAALERMDSFERLRYQSPERRRLLLNEMIELELLAQEAKRRGLDKQPETQERLRQMLRDELLRDVRKDVPSPNDLPEADVRRYFEEHKAEFNEPERRRVAHIALLREAEAKTVLEKALKAEPAEWGKLVGDYSLDKPKGLGAPPAELAGDLGIVGPPGHPRGGNPRVSEVLRAAVFKINEVGKVLPEIVADGGKFHVLRMTGRTEARERSFAEAERTIRIAIVQSRVKEREAELEKSLRGKFPVTIDDAELAKVPLPNPTPSGKALAPLRPAP